MSDVTRILNAIEQGDAKATNELLPVVYEELRLLAAQKLSAERAGQTLQATALVHEAYLRLVGDGAHHWSSRAHFFGAAATVGGLIASLLLKNFFARPRPEFASAAMHVTTASFPSGHSMLAAVVYLTLGALLARTSTRYRHKLYFLTVALAITMLVGLSRIYLGVHYPTDVLAGWSFGLIWALLCWLVARFLQRRGAIEPPEQSV